MDLLKINNYTIVKPRSGKMSISYSDVYSEYMSEAGTRTIEATLTNKISGSVTYDALLSSDLTAIKNAITLVSTLKIYDPMTNTIKTISALISGISTTMIAHRTDADVWSLTFNFEQL